MIRLLAIFLFAGFFTPEPQVHFVNEAKGPEVVLSLTSTLISGNTVKIGYDIPYPGYIEFVLRDPSGEKLWYNAYVKEKGSHFLAFKREKLEIGTTYGFEFWYKGKKYPGTFVNS